MLSVIVAIRSWTAGDCLEAALTSGFVAVVDSGVAGCSGAVTSITGDGTVFNNSASTGAVTLSLAGAGKYTVLGNGTSTNGTAPTYQSSPGVEGIDFHGSTSGSCLINMGAFKRNASDLRCLEHRNYERSLQRIQWKCPG